MTRAFRSCLFLALAACSSSSSNSAFFDGTDGGGAGGGGSGNLSGDDGSAGHLGAGDGSTGTLPDGSVVVSTTIYANTDDSLYSMDPQTRAVTLLGPFAGTGGGTNDTSVTDCAVDASGNVYVNTESVVYRAALPQSAGGPVQLTKVATIAAKSGQRFYALAFAPPGVLGAGETLIGGDGNGELWSIDPTNGTTRDLGNFGPDPNKTGYVLALSGDVVLYSDANGKPTGLATIRSCKAGTTTCSKTSDYLAGIDMAALAAAFTSGTPATSLLAGIYGGSASSTGAGTNHGELFGLGAWNGDVYAFSRSTSSGAPASLLSIDTTTGAGSVLPDNFTFTNGWSGAGVTTKVTVKVPPPPPPPK